MRRIDVQNSHFMKCDFPPHPFSHYRPPFPSTAFEQLHKKINLVFLQFVKIMATWIKSGLNWQNTVYYSFCFYFLALQLPCRCMLWWILIHCFLSTLHQQGPILLIKWQENHRKWNPKKMGWAWRLSILDAVTHPGTRCRSRSKYCQEDNKITSSSIVSINLKVLRNTRKCKDFSWFIYLPGFFVFFWQEKGYLWDILAYWTEIKYQTAGDIWEKWYFINFRFKIKVFTQTHNE